MSAYVYNPLKPLSLMFGGREYKFPVNTVTTIEDQEFSAADEYRRNNPSQPDANARLTHKIPALAFAKMVLHRQYLFLENAGFTVTEKPPTEDEKKAAHVKATAFKREQVDEALQERRERQSGGHGRLHFEPEVIEWMKELGIEDPIYNANPAGDMPINAATIQAITSAAASAAAQAVAHEMNRKSA